MQSLGFRVFLKKPKKPKKAYFTLKHEFFDKLKKLLYKSNLRIFQKLREKVRRGAKMGKSQNKPPCNFFP
jgi:hypothetical protein